MTNKSICFYANQIPGILIFESSRVAHSLYLIAMGYGLHFQIFIIHYYFVDDYFDKSKFYFIVNSIIAINKRG
jgi:hypothetical protein